MHKSTNWQELWTLPLGSDPGMVFGACFPVPEVQCQPVAFPQRPDRPSGQHWKLVSQCGLSGISVTVGHLWHLVGISQRAGHTLRQQRLSSVKIPVAQPVRNCGGTDYLV